MSAYEIAEKFLMELESILYEASGAISLAAQRARLDSSGGALAMTLAAPGTDLLPGQAILIVFEDATAPSTVQYPVAGGTRTRTLSVVDEAILLIALSADRYIEILGNVQGGAFTQTYSTADRTVAAMTAAALTENSGSIGGTNDGDLPDLSATAAALTEGGGAIGGTQNGDITSLVDPAGDSGASVIDGIRENAVMINALVADNVALRAAVRENAVMINALVADVLAMKKNDNAIIDDLQAAGISG